MDAETLEHLLALDLFEGITDSMRDIIGAETRLKTLDAGETLFLQGSPSNDFYVVTEGWVTVYRLQPSGNRVVLHVFGRGESFAEVAALGMKEYPATAEAASEAAVLCIRSNTYKKLITADPDFAMKVIAHLAQRMRTLISEFESSQRGSGSRRLAAFLVSLAEHSGSNHGQLRLPFSKQTLAARLHMQPESLSRAFAELRKLGIETRRDGTLSIADLSRLRRFAAA